MNISKIEDLRKKASLTQEQFANKIGLTKNGYGSALKRKDFKVSTLQLIANYFGVDISCFFTTKEENSVKDQIVLANEPKLNYGLKNENLLLKKRIADLEKIVELLEYKLANRLPQQTT